MKLPNGFGSVYKLPGNRRKPWAVRITVSRTQDKDGNMHWKYKYLGYYESQQEALSALVHYNENPYDLDSNKITFQEVFEKWSEKHYEKISRSNIIGYNAAYTQCSSLYSMKFNDIKLAHLQAVVDTCGKNYPTLKKLKNLFSAMYKYAIQNDICGKDYAKFVDINQYKDRNPNSISRIPFSTEEIDTLWRCKSANPYYSVFLMLIYSGVRIGELLDLKKEDVNLEEHWFQIQHSKTESGIRKVPIADKVYPFYEKWMEESATLYLISTGDGKRMTYDNFLKRYWTALCDQLGMNHKPHDTRHTCVSLLAAAGIDERTIKKIVGHSGQGVTEQVYTHIEIQQLLDAINQI